MSARFTFEPALEIDGAEARRALGLIEVVQGDITAAAVDAIVNAANEALAGGGGVDGAIHAAAGPGLSGACRALPEVRPGVRCPTGEARITPGFRLPARHVIHTVGPVWHGGQRGEPALLASCYCRSVQLAAEHSLETLAFPAISTGIFGYPLESAARVSVSALANALGAAASIRAVQLIAFGEPTASVLRATLNRAREVVGTEGTATDAAHDGAQPALTPEVAVVNAWLAASNAADVERVLAVCAPDVELVGPRGTLRGREALRAWLGRANATFESRRVFQRGEEVVVEQHGTWRTPAGELQGEASVASRFSVRAGLITRIQRHETLAEALAHAGIEPALQPG